MQHLQMVGRISAFKTLADPVLWQQQQQRKE
jgi:hypothetical protein